MADKKQRHYQSSGVNIEEGQMWLDGDLVGRSKVATAYHGLSEREVAFLKAQFAQIRARLVYHRLPGNDNIHIKTIVRRLEQEVLRGEHAMPVKVEQWLRFLATMADDVFDVVVATLTHPAAGMSKVIRLVSWRVQEDVNEGRG